MKSTTKKLKWNDIKDGMKIAVQGYLMRWGYESRTKKNLDEIHSSVIMMFEGAKGAGMLDDYRVFVNAQKAHPIEVKVEFKTTPRAKSKMWIFTVNTQLKTAKAVI